MIKTSKKPFTLARLYWPIPEMAIWISLVVDESGLARKKQKEFMQWFGIDPGFVSSTDKPTMKPSFFKKRRANVFLKFKQTWNQILFEFMRTRRYLILKKDTLSIVWAAKRLPIGPVRGSIRAPTDWEIVDYPPLLRLSVVRGWRIDSCQYGSRRRAFLS